MEDSGYDKDRFTNIQGESFDCIICSCVVKNPKECTNCGSLFCSSCIDSWLVKRKECPNRCQTAQTGIKPASKALLRLYNDLDIKCQFYDKCGKTLKVIDLEAHEKVCQLPKCLNYTICQNNAKNDGSKVCSDECLLLTKIQSANNDYAVIYKEITAYFKTHVGQTIAYVQPSNDSMILDKSLVSTGDGATVFKWDKTKCGNGIEISNNGMSCFLKEGPYMFRTVLGDVGFKDGVHYWEIHADSRTDNELKIGIATKNDFNFNSAFCDYEYGFAFYGLAQLRHGSNASGTGYGKKFKKEGVLGCFLDMNRGILSFSLNGEFLGQAFKSDTLKKGPIWPAVSLLHCAGCKLEVGKKAPSFFF